MLLLAAFLDISEDLWHDDALLLASLIFRALSTTASARLEIRLQEISKASSKSM